MMMAHLWGAKADVVFHTLLYLPKGTELTFGAPKRLARGRRVKGLKELDLIIPLINVKKLGGSFLHFYNVLTSVNFAALSAIEAIPNGLLYDLSVRCASTRRAPSS